MLTHVMFAFRKQEYDFDKTDFDPDNQSKVSWYWIKGSTLLQYVQEVAQNLKNTQVTAVRTGVGTSTLPAPYQPTPSGNAMNAETWLQIVGQIKDHDRPHYFLIGGRTISQGEEGRRYYIMDRTAVSAEMLGKKLTDTQKNAAESQPRRYSFIYYKPVEGVARYRAGAKKIPANEMPRWRVVGPSYPDYAKFVRGFDALRNQDGSAAFAVKLRELLVANRAEYNHAERSTSDICLPVLLTTIFLAEAARNPRSSVINLMLLDLIQASITYGNGKYYTWDKVLWHPDKLEAEETGLVGGNLASKPQRTAAERSAAVVAGRPKIKDLHLTGGKLAAAMTGSGHKNVANKIDPDKYYTQEKEVTILIRWLCGYFPGLYAVQGDPKRAKKEEGIQLKGQEIDGNALRCEAHIEEDFDRANEAAFARGVVFYLKYEMLMRARSCSLVGSPNYPTEGKFTALGDRRLYVKAMKRKR